LNQDTASLLEVGLWLNVIACNLGNLWRQNWSVVAPWKALGLKTGLELRVCKPPGVGASLIQDSKMEIPAIGTMVPRWQRSIEPWAELPKAENAMLTGLLVTAFTLTMAIPAFAQDQAPAKMLRTGATVEKFDGQKLTVKTDTGEELSLTLPADLSVVRSRPATVADVKAGQFIGCTAVEGPDGKLRAREINILPESMRGVGEGHYPWGGAPKTTMTNGNIEHVAGITDGNVIKVSYKGGQTEIQIRPGVTVTVIEVAGRDALKPGTKITLIARKNSDGTLTSRFIRIAA
jgi:hypothetical protein